MGDLVNSSLEMLIRLLGLEVSLEGPDCKVDPEPNALCPVSDLSDNGLRPGVLRHAVQELLAARQFAVDIVFHVRLRKIFDYQLRTLAFKCPAKGIPRPAGDANSNVWASR